MVERRARRVITSDVLPPLGTEYIYTLYISGHGICDKDETALPGKAVVRASQYRENYRENYRVGFFDLGQPVVNHKAK